MYDYLDDYGNEVTIEDSGASSTGDGGFNWGMVFSNAGGIFAGGAALINALNGKPSVNIQNPNTRPNTANNNITAGMGNILWLIVGLVIILVLFMMFKK